MANVLIVDDQAELVELSSELLESAGHRVRWETTARKG